MSTPKPLTMEEIETLRGHLNYNGRSLLEGAAAIAIEHLLARVREQPIEVDCESCGAAFWTITADDALCRGCGLTVCDECTIMFEHIENEAHGTGDPATAVTALRARVRELEES